MLWKGRSWRSKQSSIFLDKQGNENELSDFRETLQNQLPVKTFVVAFGDFNISVSDELVSTTVVAAVN